MCFAHLYLSVDYIVCFYIAFSLLHSPPQLDEEVSKTWTGSVELNGVAGCASRWAA
jgi:hypothetical protein